ncbi:MAG: hypothetical protein KAS32_07265, partial [Candidatus Peribacteraceae bacterium]|nr:hypothetical protein [Candidatus Peribacteraceae bacterium]
MEVKLTKFSRTDGDKLLCKKVLLQEGELVKTASANMLTGKFETITLDFHNEFGSFLQELSLDQALGMGICQFCSTGDIVTRSSDKENVSNNKLCRTKDNFVWNKNHNLIFFDIDKNKADITEIIADLFSVCPELAATDLWAYPSAGSCVTLDAEDHDKVKHIDKAISGWHIYLLIKGDVSKFQQWIEVKLWNAGKGWIEISKSGAMLKRCLVDLAVFSPERLDFIAGSHCGEGVTQDRGEPVRFESGTGEPLTGSWEVTSEEYTEYLARVERAKFGKEAQSVAKKKDYAGKLVTSGKAPDIPTALKLIESANEDGELMGSWMLTLDSGKEVSVATVLDRPDQFDGLTCSDPLEPDYGGGRCKAKIFWNIKGSNEIRITSFAHGGRQWLLKYDYKSLLDWLESEGVTVESIIASWKNKMTSKNSVITPEERSDILKKIKARMGGSTDLKTLKNTLSKIELKEAQHEIDEEIAELNKSFAVLPIGNKVRILREFEAIA